jgi:hypothetical protein
MSNKDFLRGVGFGTIVVALVGVAAFAGPTLQNGDFSAPDLIGWTVEYGTVTDGGGYALFEEDAFSLSSTLSQVFSLPSGSQTLSFDVWMSAVTGGDYDPFAWQDAFTASLLDPVTFDPLISNPGVTEFYYLDNTGYEETVGTVSGNKVSLDVSSWAGYDVLLSFDLWGGLDGMHTTVSLDNVNISVVPAPGALLLGLIGTGAVGLSRRFSRSS